MVCSSSTGLLVLFSSSSSLFYLASSSGTDPLPRPSHSPIAHIFSTYTPQVDSLSDIPSSTIKHPVLVSPLALASPPVPTPLMSTIHLSQSLLIWMLLSPFAKVGVLVTLRILYINLFTILICLCPIVFLSFLCLLFLFLTLWLKFWLILSGGLIWKMR